MHHPLNRLPQLERIFLTDGGLETDLMFNRGIALPGFSAAMVLRTEAGRQALDDYFRPYLDLARRAGTGFVLESATWRASPAWADALGIGLDELARLNAAAVVMLIALREDYPDVPTIVSGCHGPRGDGYDPGRIMSRDEAHEYHLWQARILAGAGAEMLSGITMTNVNEAVGIVRAARDVARPVAISFTVETDGRLPTGDALDAAIDAVDEATDGYPAYFMVNCAHPSHFAEALTRGSAARRVRGLRANASRCSHDELEAMTELDSGDPDELGREHRIILDRLPQIRVLGGCCGTDLRHVGAIAAACLEPA